MKSVPLTKRIINALLYAGVVSMAMTTPRLFENIERFYVTVDDLKRDKKSRKQLSDTFGYLKRRGLIHYEVRNKQLYISLTKEGRKLAGKYQIDDLIITKPCKWDKRWRIIIFDIPENVKIKREALRGKLKELDFFQVQKSVWVHPYDCHKQLELLKHFFGLLQNQLIIIETDNLGSAERMVLNYYKP